MTATKSIKMKNQASGHRDNIFLKHPQKACDQNTTQLPCANI